GRLVPRAPTRPSRVGRGSPVPARRRRSRRGSTDARARAGGPGRARRRIRRPRPTDGGGRPRHRSRRRRGGLVTTVPPVYLLDGVRVPFGRVGRALSELSATDLGSAPVAEVLRRHPEVPVDATLLGVVVQAGLGQNPARIAALAGGMDPTVPAVTLNSVCLASLETVCDAARRIAVG